MGPLAREDVEVNEVEDGLVVYDVRAERVHYLNPLASLVYLLCTGERDEPAIVAEAATVADRPGLADEVAECLATLRREGLVS